MLSHKFDLTEDGSYNPVVSYTLQDKKDVEDICFGQLIPLQFQQSRLQKKKFKLNPLRNLRFLKRRQEEAVKKVDKELSNDSDKKNQSDNRPEVNLI